VIVTKFLKGEDKDQLPPAELTPLKAHALEMVTRMSIVFPVVVAIWRMGPVNVRFAAGIAYTNQFPLHSIVELPAQVMSPDAGADMEKLLQSKVALNVTVYAVALEFES